MDALVVGSNLEGGKYHFLWVCVLMCGRWVRRSGVFHFLLFFLKQYLSLNLALVCSDKLASRQVPKSLLSPFPSTAVTSRHHHVYFFVSSNDSVLLSRIVKYCMETSLYSPVLCGFKHAWFSNSLARIPVTPRVLTIALLRKGIKESKSGVT